MAPACDFVNSTLVGWGCLVVVLVGLQVIEIGAQQLRLLPGEGRERELAVVQGMFSSLGLM